MVRARKGAVHNHNKYVLSVSSGFLGQEWQDRTAQPRWIGAMKDKCPPFDSGSTALIGAAKCSQGLEDHPRGLLAAIDYLLSGLPRCCRPKEGCREAEGGRQLSPSIHVRQSSL